MPFDGEVREELVHFRFGHLLRVAFALEQDETFGPIVVGVFGANGVVPNAARVPEAVEELGLKPGMSAAGVVKSTSVMVER